ncbi:FixH family protein [Paenibacillus sp. BSR1-1]|uniref:FixH family protein n=1 Tax=Paenibacillus sp. BSR1-1 TaxID=3020845 RepID=UPI0025B134F1|nr:FixH family protein [Paenibacillus sp. BSR1-1]MDN3019370.1 FixH family protein [Paenibacillus sp. BSR1-1]
MKKFVIGIISVLFLIVAVSCSKEEKQSSELPEMLEVNLSINPEPAKLNQPVTFEAKVSQGKEAVNDADEVIFEIWRSKDEKHQKIAIKNPKNGIYRLEKSFDQEGTYYIVSHVTARDMHNMPKKEFVVGTPSEKEDPNAKDSMEGMNMEEHNKGH